MKNINSILISDDRVDLILDVIIYEEDQLLYAYAPALDLVGYGETVDQAKASFETVLNEYLKYGIVNKTLEADLRKHGWTEKEKETFKSPNFVDILRQNQQLQAVLDNNYTKVSEKYSYSFC